MQMKNALLVIDVQPGFTRGNNELVELINEHITNSNYDKVISTIFVNSMYSNYIKYLNWSRIMEVEEPQIKSDEVIVKHGYGLDIRDYEKLYRNYHYDLVGISTEACVSKIAMDMFDLGHDFCVLERLCRSTGGLVAHDCAIEVLRRNIGSALIRSKNE